MIIFPCHKAHYNESVEKEMETRGFYNSIYEKLRALDHGDGYEIIFCKQNQLNFMIGLLRQDKGENLMSFKCLA